MMFIGTIGKDTSVPCATCNHHWNVHYLVRDLGQQRLRGEGFAYILFDDGAILVNYCPRCDAPATAAVHATTGMQEMAAAA